MLCSAVYTGAGNTDSRPHVCFSGSSLAETVLQPVPQTLLDSIGINTVTQPDGP